MDKYAEDNKRVQLKVPDQYREFTDVFSKQASDELPPLRPQVDHKIELTSENTLGHSPLYRQTTEELLAIKEYLLENLDKGFIVLSLVLFVLLIFFVKKSNRSL